MCEAHKSPSNTHWTVKSPGRLDISHRRSLISIQESRVLLERTSTFISCSYVFLKTPHYTVGQLSRATTNWMDKGLQDQLFLTCLKRDCYKSVNCSFIQVTLTIQT